MDSFYMVLPSNSCPGTQPNNEASNYIVDYENSINFHGTWQVAMTEVMIFYTPSTIRKGSFIKYQEIKKATTLDGGCIISRDDMILQQTFFGTKGLPILINLNNKKLSLSSSKNFNITFRTKEEAEDWGFKVEHNISKQVNPNSYVLQSDKDIDKEDGKKINITISFKIEKSVTWKKIVFKEDVPLDSSEKLVTYLKTHCKDIFKTVTVSKDNYLSLTLNDTIHKTSMNRHLAMVLGFTKPKNSHTDVTADSRLKLNNAFNQVYIYSSVVEPIMVGSHRVPLLRSVWIDSTIAKHGQPISYTPQHLMYLPISSTSINKIEVNIRDDNGTPIVSCFGAKTILTLHFKKIHD